MKANRWWIAGIAAVLVLTGLALFIANRTAGPGTGRPEPSADVTTAPTEAPETKATAKVLNNGGNFVSVDGKVYYREYGPYSLPGSAIGGTFTDCGENYGGAILRYVEGDGEPETLAENDKGCGPLYYYDGWLYSQTTVDYTEPAVYRVNVKDGTEEIVCNGYLRGGSAARCPRRRQHRSCPHRRRTPDLPSRCP